MLVRGLPLIVVRRDRGPPEPAAGERGAQGGHLRKRGARLQEPRLGPHPPPPPPRTACQPLAGPVRA
eukprot:scaffold1626_cov372-Prasinococcus_capsulatus_cf.AAC.27